VAGSITLTTDGGTAANPLSLSIDAGALTLAGQGVGVSDGAALVHGSALTLTGTGFGTRADNNSGNYTWNGAEHLHFRFKDFRDGAINSDGLYAQRGGSSWTPGASMTIQAGGPTNSDYYIRRIYTDVESGGLSCDTSGAGDYLYTSFKFRCDSVENQQAGKLFRAYAGDSKNFYISAGGGDLYIRGNAENISGSSVEWGSGYEITEQDWNRIEIYADKTTGSVKIWLNGWLATNRTWVDSTTNWNGHTIDYPNMIDDESRGYGILGEYEFCDIYTDFTAARVEMTTSATWSDVFGRASPSLRTHEPQIVTSWADTSITCRVNKGEFADNSTVYLHVIGADNAPIGSAFGPYTVQ
jgi:hypothetical protein